MAIIRRSVSEAAAARSARAGKRLDQDIHELNNGRQENVFIEGAVNPRGGAGNGIKYRDLGGFDDTLLVKR